MTMPIPAFYFIGAAAILFIAGIFFIIKGAAFEDQEAVPISNFNEVEALREPFSPSDDAPETQESAEASDQTRVRKLIAENQRLMKADQQPRETGQEQAQEAGGALLDKLKAKNLLLEKQNEEGANQRTELEAAISKLKAERDDLLDQVKKREEQAAELHENLATLQKTGDEKLKTVQATADQLRAQRDEEERAGPKISKDRFDESMATIEDLKQENQKLQQAVQDLKDHFKKTEELNAHLLEKEKKMQYELTKNRAQALGLEKICEDFKVRIEAKAASTAAE